MADRMSAERESAGPVMWCTVRCPRPSRCVMAARTPCTWSAGADGQRVTRVESEDAAGGPAGGASPSTAAVPAG